MADVTFTATDVQKESGETVEFAAAGEAITAGDSIFKDAGDGLVYQGHAATGSDGEKPDAGDDLGVALGGGSAGQIIPYLKRRGDKVDFGSGTFTAGQWYVVSDTAGGIMPASDLGSGDYSIGLGYAETDAILVLRPDRTGVQLA